VDEWQTFKHFFPADIVFPSKPKEIRRKGELVIWSDTRDGPKLEPSIPTTPPIEDTPRKQRIAGQ
jgi:hypothetical protein